MKSKIDILIDVAVVACHESPWFCPFTKEECPLKKRHCSAVKASDWKKFLKEEVSSKKKSMEKDLEELKVRVAKLEEGVK